MTQAKANYGTILKRAGYEVAELTNIGTPEMIMETVDVTNHQSPNSYREFIGTFFDGGEVPIEGNFIPTDTNGQMGLAQDFAAKTLQNFEIIFPNGASFAFSALVTRIKVADATIDGVLGFSATLKVSGKPILSATFAPDLTGLVVTTGVLVPALTASKYDYVAIIGTAETSVTITPTCATADSILVDGVLVVSGAASGSISLGAAGSVTPVEVVVRAANKADRIYTIQLVRE